MARDPDDDTLTLATLIRWQKERPEAAIVIAAADTRNLGEPLDIGLRLSNHNAAHLVGIAMVLIDTALADVAAHASPSKIVLDRLRTAIAALSGRPQTTPPPSRPERKPKPRS
jgi:hypothetical protein